MTVRALFSMGINVLGGIYIRLITRVSMRYGEIFHMPKARVKYLAISHS